jgi:glycerol uptake facilitator-like aquaporin
MQCCDFCVTAGPAMVFGCGWKAAPVYILAELLGGVAGSVISWPLYGTGLQFGRCGHAAHATLTNNVPSHLLDHLMHMTAF